MQQKKLSAADSRILAQVFDPESAPTRPEILVDPSLPEDRLVVNVELLHELKGREKVAIALVEQSVKSNIAGSESETAYTSALDILNKLVEEHPQYASARNNRAQLRRWRYGDRHTLCQETAHRDSERRLAGIAAVSDLKETIALASPEHPYEAVSPAQGRLLAQAYTQLAALYYAAYKDLDSSAVVDVAPSGTSVWSRNRFEEEASRMFYLGGLYGNEVAKALAVHTNPHAKLCGSIVKEAMKQELAAMQG